MQHDERVPSLTAKQLTIEESCVTRPYGERVFVRQVHAEDRAMAWAGAERLTKHPEACFGERRARGTEAPSVKAVTTPGRL